MSCQTQVPQVVRDHFGAERSYGHGGTCAVYVAQAFKPGEGWKRYPFNKRISVSWARKMRREGYVAVALTDTPRPLDVSLRAMRVADFTLNEIVRGGTAR